MPIANFGRFGLFGGISLDTNAKAYISNITDMPYQNKVAINNLVLYLKANSLWAKVKYLIISPVTISETEAYRDLISNTILAVPQPQGASLDQRNAISAYPIGYLAPKGNASQWITSGAILSSLGLSVTSACVFWGEKRTVTTAGHAHGCIVSGTSRSYLRIVSTAVFGQMFSAVQSSVTPVTTAGRWFFNRNAANYIEIVRDNSIFLSNAIAEAGSTITNIENYIFASNTGGSPTGSSYTDGIKDYWGVADGLSTADRALLDTGMNNFRTDMKRSGDTYTKQVVLGGNSICLRGSQRFLRRAMYDYGMSNVGIFNAGISGQTTTQMVANYATNEATMYDGTLTKNVYLINEIGNDLSSGVTLAQAKTNITTLVSAAQATGYFVIVVVPTLRTYVGNVGGLSETTWNLNYDNIIQWVRAGSSGANAFANITDTNMMTNRSDYASDAAFNTGVSTILTNTTYYSADQLHPVIAGLDIIGNSVGISLESNL